MAAVSRASDYLATYSGYLTAESGGNILVTYTVGGCGRMSNVGATSVRIYESKDEVNWTRVKTFLSAEESAMLKQNSYTYSGTPVSYTGVAGRYYYAEINIYAGNDKGSDSRLYTTDVVQAKS